ncbi:aminotransferase [Brucella sp. BE17]|uniref:aminotransferase n=1 Tax=Brucella sp. BE17 TaxID=3142977 RepID=UPI0031BAF8E6
MIISGSNSLRDRDIRYTLHSQTNPSQHEQSGPFIIARGDGPYVFDSDGKKYLDAMAGLWCASLGFTNDRLAQAAAKAYETLGFYHTFGGRASPAAITAAQDIAELVPIEDARVFFATSGSEAIETMVKLTWLHFKALGQEGRRKIIARDRAFHGSTIFSASLTGLPHMHREFGLPGEGIVRVACPDPYQGPVAGESEEDFCIRLATELEDAILREGPETIGAFIAEPINAGAGVIVPPESYFTKVQAILKKYGILFLADEIVCGFGRTGQWFGCDTMGIKPDMMAMAKGLSSSYFPISAVAVSQEIYQSVKSINSGSTNFGHGFTNSGHPVGAAIVTEAIALYREMEVLNRVSTLGDRLIAHLQRIAENYSIVGHVRGKGLLLGAEIVADRQTKQPFAAERQVLQKIDQRARNAGIILRPQGNTITFCPPFIIDEEQVDEIAAVFEEAVSHTENNLGY